MIYYNFNDYKKSVLKRFPKYYLKELLEDDNAQVIKSTKSKLIEMNLDRLWELLIDEISSI